MYEAHYGLTCKPFQLNPDPTFYFGSKQHRRAKAYLDYGVARGEGFIVITGEVGAGKTTILRGLLDSLDPAKVVAGNVVSTQLGAEDTLRMVASSFGVKTKDASKADLLMSLEAFLVSQTVQGKRCLLIVDEAQNLTAGAVEELRMLSNFQFGNQSLLQSFLVGQPEFRAILQHPHMQQLRQRVIAACHIGPLDLDETRGYVEHRLTCAGWSAHPFFDPAVYAAIFEGSGGIPRRINNLCDRLLLLGFLAEKHAFSVDDVQTVVQEIREESGGSWGGANLTVGGAARDALPNADLYAADGLAFDPAVVDGLAAHVTQIDEEQYADRLQRLERSMLRMERINLELLSTLKKLLSAVRRPQEDPVP